jgi:hypothetical protein
MPRQNFASFPVVFVQVIPEGAGPVKTNLCVVLVRCAGFLVLVGRVEVGVGVKARAEPDRVAAAGLDGGAVGRMLFRAGRSKLVVLLSAWVTRWSLASSVPGFPARGRRWGCRSFLRRGVRHEAVRRETVGRDQSEGATSPGSGVMTCTIRADREPGAHAARGEPCRARMW